MRRKHRIIMGLICAVLVFCTALSPLLINTSAADYRIGYVNDPVDSCLRIRSGPGTNNSILGELDHGTELKIYSETNVSGIVWYQVTCMLGGAEISGYVSSEYVVVPAEDGNFDSYLEAQNFPESYKDSLRILHSIYPNWQFIAVNTGLDWNTVIDAESKVGVSLVPYSWDKAYINTKDVDSNGKQIGRDGANWVSASRAAVEYYMDPRNALTTPYIFQFEVLSYNSSVHVQSGVQNILNGTFMSGSFPYNGGSVSYAQTFMDAASVSGVSPYHLASRVRQEQGLTGTTLSDGNVSGYSGYYNFFNIDAYTTSGASASVNGAKYAKTVSSKYYGPWTSPYNSILGGSIILGESYIADGQDTLYYQKFNVVEPPLFGHQYMTNVAAARSESYTLMDAYSEDVLKGALVFKIPVYDNMPVSASPLPTEVKQEDNSGAVPSVTPKYTSSVYTITDSLISKISVGTDVTTLMSNVAVTDGRAVLTNSSGAAKTTGTVNTGDILQIYYKDSTRVYKNIKVAVNGDVNGDGKISIMDLMMVKKQLLGTAAFGAPQKTAGDINKNNTIDIVDLMMIQKHLLGTYTIE